MFFRDFRKRLKKSFAKNSLYQYIFGSYVLIILIMVIPTIYSMAIWQYNRSSYDKIIKNVGKANTILKVGSEDIPEELWNIVCGRINVRQGNQSNLLRVLETGLKEMMADKNAQTVNRNLQLAFRTYQTLNRNIDLFESQLEQNASVEQSELMLDEIRSISNLFAQIMRDFIVSEIESAEKANNNIQNSSYFLLLIQIMIVLTVGVLIIVTFKTLSKKIKGPISKMEKFSTQLAAGNLQAQIDTPNITEFSHLVENLNSMARQIDRLMKQNIEEQTNLQKEELAKLQAQITPHFLYNTFDTIIWLAEAGKKDEVVEITRAFSNFMRISLSRGHDWITIEQEIEHVKNYLTIQKVRYGDILNYEFFVDERLNNFMILKLSLQPLIENAIYHGIKNKRGRGHINITAQFTDEKHDKIKICVIDDGAGFTAERLEEVRKELDTEDGKNLASVYGLYNVNKRLILYYNDKACGLNISSEKMKGTNVSFTIPCIVDAKEN